MPPLYLTRGVWRQVCRRDVGVILHEMGRTRTLAIYSDGVSRWTKTMRLT
jgi:hypothetical protein